MNRISKCLVGIAAFASMASAAIASNPLITQTYTADPNAFIYNDRIYVICSHDLPNQRGYDLFDYELVSTDDLQNWTDHGIVFSLKTDASWATHCYAPGMAVKDGKCYLYFPDGGSSIGVAVADKPEGPYKDPLGKALISNSVPSYRSNWLFDPAGFIDDDGRVFVYYGGNGDDQARILELKKDMITPMSDKAVHLNVPRFFEASFMHKYKGKYYFSYSLNFNGQPAAAIGYMMGDSPTGPFEYKGSLLDNPPENMGNNNHASIVEYKGHWYVIYHNRKLSRDNKLSNPVNTRSINLDEMFYNEDGTIKKVEPTWTGPKQLKNVDPTAKNRFVTMNKSVGLETANIILLEDRTSVIANPKAGAWTRVTGVDLGKAKGQIEVRYSAKTAGELEVRADKEDGAVIATVKLAATNGKFATAASALKKTEGVHDVYFIYKAADAQFDTWQSK